MFVAGIWHRETKFKVQSHKTFSAEQDYLVSHYEVITDIHSLPLSMDFLRVIDALPSVYTYDGYKAFIDQYGTHWSKRGSYGGRAGGKAGECSDVSCFEDWTKTIGSHPIIVKRELSLISSLIADPVKKENMEKAVCKYIGDYAPESADVISHKCNEPVTCCPNSADIVHAQLSFVFVALVIMRLF
eukprot:m.34497 g.34497  ORF g.34497 m.34497 type:complete len:186 (+) comp8741_c0_seq1:331-888(+)